MYLIRGQKVILDYHLAALYKVETRVLKQAVKRNMDLFPSDFMLVLTAPISHTGGLGHRSYLTSGVLRTFFCSAANKHLSLNKRFRI